MSIRFLFFYCFFHNLIGPIVKSTQTNESEQRGRSLYPKQQDQERARSLSSQTIFDPVHARLSKSNENITQSIPQKTSSLAEQRTERITKSEDRNSSTTNVSFNDLQFQRYYFLKDKFERQQPIDTVFGIQMVSSFSRNSFLSFTDSRRYPFKILIQHPYPLVNFDVHILSM